MSSARSVHAPPHPRPQPLGCRHPRLSSPCAPSSARTSSCASSSAPRRASMASSPATWRPLCFRPLGGRTRAPPGGEGAPATPAPTSRPPPPRTSLGGRGPWSGNVGPPGAGLGAPNWAGSPTPCVHPRSSACWRPWGPGRPPSCPRSSSHPLLQEGRRLAQGQGSRENTFTRAP